MATVLRVDHLCLVNVFRSLGRDWTLFVNSAASHMKLPNPLGVTSSINDLYIIAQPPSTPSSIHVTQHSSPFGGEQRIFWDQSTPLKSAILPRFTELMLRISPRVECGSRMVSGSPHYLVSWYQTQAKHCMPLQVAMQHCGSAWEQCWSPAMS